MLRCDGDVSAVFSGTQHRYTAVTPADLASIFRPVSQWQDVPRPRRARAHVTLHRVPTTRVADGIPKTVPAREWDVNRT